MNNPFARPLRRPVQTLSFFAGLLLLGGAVSCADYSPIDRQALVQRHTVRVQAVDSLASLSVGNGNFAFTVDATGLQSFPERYSAGVPLGTQAQWGWHSFPNTEKYTPQETFKAYDFRGRDELYAVQFNEKGRQQKAADYYRANPHRLHLGYVGLEFTLSDGRTAGSEDLADIDQSLDMWTGTIASTFGVESAKVQVTTVCDPVQDGVSARVVSPKLADGSARIRWSFPYPTGGHSDDASDWNHPSKHQTRIVGRCDNGVVLERQLDETVYYVSIRWQGPARFEASARPHVFYLIPQSEQIEFSTLFAQGNPLEAQNVSDACPVAVASACCTAEVPEGGAEAEVSKDAAATQDASLFENIQSRSAAHWQQFWQSGGAVDFSECTDARAFELERRVVLSQYLTAIQCAGQYPPQETGLTYNSWFGKYHLEMHWWHGAHFALWGRDALLQPSLEWYDSAAPYARGIAARQGFRGVRWMKMTDPSAVEAPSKVGSFLLWQQPHYIYLAELVRRNHPDDTAVVERYKDLVFATAEFLADFVDYDGMGDRYVIKGIIPAQETLRADRTVNPPLELSYVHFALQTAQQWRQRLGMPKNMEWETVLDKLSPLAYNDDKLYLAAETAEDTYVDTRFTSDHMAVLGALGMMPQSRLVRRDIMNNTFDWIWDNWNWGKTWGWDYPLTAMCAARLGRPDKAVDALLMDRRTNTYLVNGHNYQDGRLRLYLPGNGGLLTAVAMMCAGWDGCPEAEKELDSGRTTHVGGPGFPADTWKVKWEGLSPMP